MNILLTIKSVLNYLYNHLIELIWVKKIKFSDGSEMVSAGGSNLKQADYFEEIKITETDGITGNIVINNDLYYNKVNGYRFVVTYQYDGNDWYYNDDVIPPFIINLSDYGIDISDITYNTGAYFKIYSVCLRNKHKFATTRFIENIYNVLLNGNLLSKTDYYITQEEIEGFNHPVINFNNYTLKYSDVISIINGEINEPNK